MRGKKTKVQRAPVRIAHLCVLRSLDVAGCLVVCERAGGLEGGVRHRRPVRGDGPHRGGCGGACHLRGGEVQGRDRDGSRGAEDPGWLRRGGEGQERGDRARGPQGHRGAAAVAPAVPIDSGEWEDRQELWQDLQRHSGTLPADLHGHGGVAVQPVQRAGRGRVPGRLRERQGGLRGPDEADLRAAAGPADGRAHDLGQADAAEAAASDAALGRGAPPRQASSPCAAGALRVHAEVETAGREQRGLPEPRLQGPGVGAHQDGEHLPGDPASPAGDREASREGRQEAARGQGSTLAQG
eukprot:scaffold1430_cov257-Pinguiococcus_pyrenoidosus.AAC.7